MHDITTTPRHEPHQLLQRFFLSYRISNKPTHSLKQNPVRPYTNSPHLKRRCSPASSDPSTPTCLPQTPTTRHPCSAGTPNTQKDMSRHQYVHEAHRSLPSVVNGRHQEMLTYSPLPSRQRIWLERMAREWKEGRPSWN